MTWKTKYIIAFSALGIFFVGGMALAATILTF